MHLVYSFLHRSGIMQVYTTDLMLNYLYRKQKIDLDLQLVWATARAVLWGLRFIYTVWLIVGYSKRISHKENEEMIGRFCHHGFKILCLSFSASCFSPGIRKVISTTPLSVQYFALFQNCHAVLSYLLKGKKFYCLCTNIPLISSNGKIGAQR